MLTESEKEKLARYKVIEQIAKTQTPLTPENLSKLDTVQAVENGAEIAEQEIKGRGINENKLDQFIKLVIRPELLENNGNFKTPDKMHTILKRLHPNKLITSRGAIEKYTAFRP